LCNTSLSFQRIKGPPSDHPKVQFVPRFMLSGNQVESLPCLPRLRSIIVGRDVREVVIDCYRMGSRCKAKSHHTNGEPLMKTTNDTIAVHSRQPIPSSPPDGVPERRVGFPSKVPRGSKSIESHSCGNEKTILTHPFAPHLLGSIQHLPHYNSGAVPGSSNRLELTDYQ
ncbi:hypothetical protein BKA70DRAFT_1306546, partial [Coprinopsis sp. MPI-PUGE-AT-0042]